MFVHLLARVIRAELVDIKLVDDNLEVSNGMVEYRHALLGLERAGGHEPTAEHFEVRLQLFLGVVTVPCWWIVMDNPYGWWIATIGSAFNKGSG